MKIGFKINQNKKKIIINWINYELNHQNSIKIQSKLKSMKNSTSQFNSIKIDFKINKIRKKLSLIKLTIN